MQMHEEEVVSLPGMTKKLLLESAIPAKALYQAAKAARIPKAPPALMHAVFGAPEEFSR